VRDFRLSMEKGEFVSLLGRRMRQEHDPADGRGFEEPDSGEVWLGDQNLLDLPRTGAGWAWSSRVMHSFRT